MIEKNCRPVVIGQMNEIFENGNPLTFEATCIRGDGKEIWVEAVNNHIVWNGNPAKLATVRDISEEKIAGLLKAENSRQQQGYPTPRKNLFAHGEFGSFVGESPVMRNIYEMIQEISSHDANVVITGESGTGKELVAKAIHEMSARSNEPFVVVNCGAVPDSLFESEFFGYRKGAFTGAHTDKHGYFDLANKGVLFLDELGELSTNMQVKLLRAIEGNGFQALGDAKNRNADVRIVAATNRNLQEMVRDGRMREDFFYRMFIVNIIMPPLRERGEDILMLADYFFSNMLDKTSGGSIFTPPIREAMMAYPWPGNVRELQNVIRRFVTIKNFDIVDYLKKQSPDSIGSPGFEFQKGGTLALSRATDDFQRQLIHNTLEANHWRKAHTASALGIDRKTLFRMIKSLGIE